MPTSGQEIGLRHDDDEFLAAKSSDEVDAAHAVKRSVGKVSKHAIPHDVAVRVVDEFEVIDVEQQDGRTRLVPTDTVDQLVQTRKQIPTVVEPR
jgi:hypothetical protein